LCGGKKICIHIFILNTIDILIIKILPLQNIIIRKILIPSTSTNLQETLAAEEHLAERQFLLEMQTLNKENSLKYGSGILTSTVSEREGRNLELWQI
jgi:hypothetical protein